LCRPCWDGANCSHALPRDNTWKLIRPHAKQARAQPINPANRTRCAATVVCDEFVVVGGEAEDDKPRAAQWPDAGHAHRIVVRINMMRS
jgi:hypothetical protein